MVIGLSPLILGLIVFAGQPAEETAAWIERLGDESWSVREAATEALGVVTRADESARDASIKEALGRADLSEEMRLRLVRVAAWRFRSAELGGLGVQFGRSGEGAVEIGLVVPGFPASGLLRPGDVVLAVDGEIVGGMEHLRAEILSRRPGETLPVWVRRDRTVQEIVLPLGSYASLQGGAALDDVTVRWAMGLRLKREGVAVERPDRVGAGLAADAWIAAAFPEGQDGTRARAVERSGPGVALGPGGADRDAGARRRGAWSTRADAARSVGEQRRMDLGLAMNAGIVARSVLVEFERALVERIAGARAIGADAAGMERTLETVRARMRELDARLLDTARAMDSAED